MKISLITICWNNERDIRPTLESVKAQTYDDIEYIVVDGASNDNTLSIVKEYESMITTLISEPDKGLYDAINKGVRNATGEFVGMIHAGDRLYDSKVIERIAGFLKANPDTDIVYGNSKIVDSNDKAKRINISPEYNKRLVRRGWMPSHQSIYARRTLFEKYGYYRNDFGGGGDYEWCVRYFYKETLRIRKINHFAIKFSLGGQSTANPKEKLTQKHKDNIKRAWMVNGLTPPRGIVWRMLSRKPIQFIRAWFD
ncbi:MAG: glycosyltransferase [Bacteroidales bacterium]|nr:glycosyltransferase [Bacteroidales bacterium]